MMLVFSFGVYLRFIATPIKITTDNRFNNTQRNGVIK